VWTVKVQLRAFLTSTLETKRLTFTPGETPHSTHHTEDSLDPTADRHAVEKVQIHASARKRIPDSPVIQFETQTL
jgi:hypothetical protein